MPVPRGGRSKHRLGENEEVAPGLQGIGSGNLAKGSSKAPGPGRASSVGNMAKHMRSPNTIFKFRPLAKAPATAAGAAICRAVGMSPMKAGSHEPTTHRAGRSEGTSQCRVGHLTSMRALQAAARSPPPAEAAHQRSLDVAWGRSRGRRLAGASKRRAEGQCPPRTVPDRAGNFFPCPGDFFFLICSVFRPLHLPCHFPSMLHAIRSILELELSILHAICRIWAQEPSIDHAICRICAQEPFSLRGICRIWELAPSVLLCLLLSRLLLLCLLLCCLLL